MKWTKEELNKAISLFNDGKKYEEISQILNRTKKAIKLKLNRNGFQIRESEIHFKEKINCVVCGKEFEGYKSNKRKFCSNSCSASYNNKQRTEYSNCDECGKETTNPHFCSRVCSYKNRKKNIDKHNCEFCNTETTNKKFCSQECFRAHKKEKKFLKVETYNGIKTSAKVNKRYLIDKYGCKCMKCGWAEKNPVTDKVPIELNHIDGNSKENCLDNLELLCPNCHALTPNYKALNIGNGRHKRMKRYNEGKSY